MQYPFNLKTPRRFSRLAILALSAFNLPGCVSPMALDRAVMAYNEATSDALYKQLLLNIARARHDQPVHFSGISNIAATLNFQANIGMTPPLTGDNGTTLMPILGLGASENPTISIVPMDGEEFTKRLMTPLSEDKLALLLRQNLDIDLLLRLVGLEFRAVEHGREVVYHNRPRNREDYAMFRRMVMHLSSVQDRDELFIEPLVFERVLSLPRASVPAEKLPDLEQEYRVSIDEAQAKLILDKRVRGRMILSNYDPSTLANPERAALNDEAERGADNDILVDIRPGHVGGEYPLRGRIRLRSFSNILNFIGRAMTFEPEYDVPRDARTPAVNENPAHTLLISESREAPDAGLSVEYRGLYYSVHPDAGYPWNATAFRLLSQIFQMNVGELPKAGAPSITIAK